MQQIFQNSRFKIVAVQIFNQGAGEFCIAPRPFHSLTYRLSGTGEFKIGDKIFSSCPGDVLFMPAGVGYNVSYTESRILGVHFLLPEGKYLSENCSFKGVNEIKYLFGQMEKTWQKKERAYELSCSAFFYEIIAQVDKARFESGKLSASECFNRAANYLENNFLNNDTTIENLCRMHYISASYFRKKFIEIYGKTPLEYITDKKTIFAQELLIKGCTVEETALLCGFSDAKYFSRLIKKRCGVTPSALKSKMRL